MIKSVMVDGSEAMKMMVDGAVAWERKSGEIILPTGYRRCKYLESNGNQYIDTGIYLTEKCGFLYDGRFYFAQNSAVIGADGNSTRSISLELCSFNYSGIEHTCIFANRSTSSIPEYYASIGDWHKYEFKKQKAYLDDDFIIEFFVENNSLISKTMKLFKVPGGFFSNGTKNAIREAAFYDENGDMINRYIPVLDSEERPCMFDTVTKQSFYNQGTGEFGYELMDGTYVAPI